MRRRGYNASAPDRAAICRTQHRGFSEQLVALRNAAHIGEPGSKAARLSFPEDWLVGHVMTIDKRLGQFILSKH
jgi:hypothetical protein